MTTILGIWLAGIFVLSAWYARDGNLIDEGDLIWLAIWPLTVWCAWWERP